VNQRKGTIDALEQCIVHHFYKDEADATEYYEDRLERKKKLGAKYNDKFFAHIQSESEEFSDEDTEEGEEE